MAISNYEVSSSADLLVEKYGSYITSVLTKDEIFAFVRAYVSKGQERVEDQILEGVRFRNSSYFQNLLTMDFPEEVFGVLSPIYIHGQDRYGNPIIWERLDILQKNLPQIREMYTDEAYLTYRHIVLKRIHNLKQEISVKRNRKIRHHTIILDVNNVGIFEIPTVMGPLKSVFQMADYYPFTVSRIIVINAGPMFTHMWTLIKFMMPEGFQVNVLGHNYLPELIENIAEDQIPQCYGGNSNVPLNAGQIYVPDLEIIQLYPESLINNTEYIMVVTADKNDEKSIDNDNNTLEKELEKSQEIHGNVCDIDN